MDNDKWFISYSQRRYGGGTDNTVKVWEYFNNTIYSNVSTGLERDPIVAARPALDVRKTTPQCKIEAKYDPYLFVQGWKMLLKDQRLNNHRVMKIYLAIRLSMFPAFAIIFIVNKLVPMDLPGRGDLVNKIFFLSSLGVTFLGVFWNKYAQQNRNYLILGGLLSLMIPFANGLITGGWVWNMWNQYPSVAYIDIFWLVTGIVALYFSFFVLKVKASSDTPEELVENDHVK